MKERERGTPPTKLFRLGRLCGLFTNRTRFSNPGSPNLTSKHQGTPDWEIGREKSPKRNNKNFVSLFLASVHTVAPPPLLPPHHHYHFHTGLSHHLDYIFFSWRRDNHGKKEKAGAPPPPPPLLLSHPCCSFFVFFFSSRCLCTLPRR